MGKQKDSVKLGYKIIKINTLKFAFKEIDEDVFEKIFNEPDSLIVDLSIGFIIDKEKSTISIDIITKLIDKESKANLIEHSGRTTFLIEGLEEIHNKEGDTYGFPDELLTHLYGLAYSHSRALLTVEISPTMYKDKYFLPVVDPRKFISKKK